MNLSTPPEQSLLRSIELVIFDFDGVFTDNFVIVSQDGVESVRCSRSDGLGLSRLRSQGVQTIIVSTETNPVVDTRAKKLQIPCWHSVADKKTEIEKIAGSYDVSLQATAFVGNDINDIGAMQIVGLSIAVADAYPEVLPHCKFQTSRAGGYGAVREVCDLIYHARNADT